MKLFISILILFIGLKSKAQLLSVVTENDTAKLWNPHTGIKSALVTSSPNTFSIGTVNSTAPLTIANNNATPLAPQAGTLAQLISSGIQGRISNDTYAGGTNGSIFQGRRAGGTPDAPTAVQSGMVLSGINGDGYGTSSFTGSGLGSMTIRAEENFTNTSKATNIQFTTTPTGSTSQLERMRIAANGDVSIAGLTTNGYVKTSGGTGLLSVSATIPQADVTNLTTDLATKISNITGLVTQGTNVTITGSGTSGSPYVISATGGGGGGLNYSQVKSISNK